ncbi:MAG TPA: glycosyltransferase [Capillimicrobium sp.]|nr:glycosyltransferase [Capillimicrobium sp.]
MRILLANKFFYPRAGAETVFFQERELLRGRGHEIVDFAMRDPQNLPSPDAAFFAPARTYVEGAGRLTRVRSAASSVYSPAARRAIRALVTARRPQLAHLHNIYHQLTTSVIDELVAQRVPVVLTLHDYKVVCPSYDLFTDHAPCRRCVGHLPWHAVKHRCIKGSLGGSALAAAEAVLTRARRSYAKADAVITPSAFLADLAATYVPADRIHVVPNFLNERPALPAPAPGNSDRPYVLFAGRLEEVKGIAVLEAALEAWDRRVDLLIAGQGPLQPRVEHLHTAGRAKYLGTLPREEVAGLMRRALAVVVPSVWEENYPMSIVEARAAGTVVICSNRGGHLEMVDHDQDGLLFDPSDPSALAASITRLLDSPDLRRSLVEHGWERTIRENSADGHYDALMRVYGSATAAVADRAPAAIAS